MKNKQYVEDGYLLTKIYILRHVKVMLDRDLTELYGVETRQLNHAVSRNMKRFPADFMFQLSSDEFKKLDITFCDIKLGRYKEKALRFYRTRRSNVIRIL